MCRFCHRRWRPAIALKTKSDHPSGSLIFSEQCLTPSGEARRAPGVHLFGHACAEGGVILRPGAHTRVLCGHGQDSGAHCNGICAHLTEGAGAHEGAICSGAWAPQDIGEWIHRDTAAYRREPGWGKYNEFLINGTHWDAHLPWSINAFLSSRSGASERAYDRFLAKYGVTEEVRRFVEAEIPLLTLAPFVNEPLVFGVTYAGAGDPTRLHRTGTGIGTG